MDNEIEEISPKSRRNTALFAIFLGVFGIHRFYLEKTRSAFVMLALGIAGFSILGIILSVRFYYTGPFAPAVGVITIFVAAGIWSLIDFIITVAGKMRDKEGRLVKRW
jgi:TM2 domain-containing membrane protein YozV